MQTDRPSAESQPFAEAQRNIECVILQVLAAITVARSPQDVAALCRDFNEIMTAHEDIQVYANRLRQRRTSGSDHDDSDLDYERP